LVQTLDDLHVYNISNDIAEKKCFNLGKYSIMLCHIFTLLEKRVISARCSCKCHNIKKHYKFFVCKNKMLIW